jgi:hypothetical protein
LVSLIKVPSQLSTELCPNEYIKRPYEDLGKKFRAADGLEGVSLYDWKTIRDVVFGFEHLLEKLETWNAIA